MKNYMLVQGIANEYEDLPDWVGKSKSINLMHIWFTIIFRFVTYWMLTQVLVLAMTFQFFKEKAKLLDEQRMELFDIFLVQLSLLFDYLFVSVNRGLFLPGYIVSFRYDLWEFMMFSWPFRGYLSIVRSILCFKYFVLLVLVTFA